MRQRKLMSLVLLTLGTYSGVAFSQNFVDDVTITTANPDIEFNDNSVTGVGAFASNDTDWEICVDDGCSSPYNGVEASEAWHLVNDSPNPPIFGGGISRAMSMRVEAFSGSTAQPALTLSSDDRVGINTKDPGATLDIKSPTGQAALRVTNIGGADNALHTILNLASNGPPSLRLRDNFNDETWQFRAKQNGGFTMNNAGTPGLELEIEKDGRAKFRNNITVDGVVIETSSRTRKENFEFVDPKSVLEKVNALSIQRWNYKKDKDEVKHFGPVAEEFYEAFGLGSTPLGISGVDSVGVALAAIQALNTKSVESTKKLAEVEQELESSQEQLAEIHQAMKLKDERIASLETKLGAMSSLMVKLNEMGKVIAFLAEEKVRAKAAAFRP